MVLTRSAAKRLAEAQAQLQGPLSLTQATRLAFEEIGADCQWIIESDGTRLVCGTEPSEAELEYRHKQQQEVVRDVFLHELDIFKRQHELDVVWEEEIMLNIVKPGDLDDRPGKHTLATRGLRPPMPQHYQIGVGMIHTLPDETQFQPSGSGKPRKSLENQPTEIW